MMKVSVQFYMLHCMHDRKRGGQRKFLFLIGQFLKIFSYRLAQLAATYYKASMKSRP